MTWSCELTHCDVIIFYYKMNNLSCSADYGKVREVEVITEESKDDRVFITYGNEDNVGYFLQSYGRALVFKNAAAAERYIENNDIDRPMIEPVRDHALSEDEMLEV